MKWLDAASILALAVSIAALAITAVGTGGAARAGSAPLRSSPIVVDAYGREVAPLGSVIGGGGNVGVILVGSASTKPESSASTGSESVVPAESGMLKSKPPISTGSSSLLSTVSVSCVNINTGDESALAALNGIGPAIAARIVSYRDDMGPFKKKEEIMNVKGIGPAKFAAIKAMICL